MWTGRRIVHHFGHHGGRSKGLVFSQDLGERSCYSTGKGGVEKNETSFPLKLKVINFVLIFSLFYSRKFLKSHYPSHNQGCHVSRDSCHGPVGDFLSSRIFRRLGNGGRSFYTHCTPLSNCFSAFQTFLSNLLARRNLMECWLAPCRGQEHSGPMGPWQRHADPVSRAWYHAPLGLRVEKVGWGGRGGGEYWLLHSVNCAEYKNLDDYHS